MINRLWRYAALTLLVFTTPANADETKVLIVGAQIHAPLVEALRLELDAASYDTRVEWRVPIPEPFSDFAEVADASKATVWIRLFDNARLDIWSIHPKSDKVLHREAILDSMSRTDPLQSAMEIAELLRATQLELYEVKAPAMTPPSAEEMSRPPAPLREQEPVSKTNEMDNKVEPSSTQNPADETVSADANTAPPHPLFIELGPGITAGNFSHPPTAYLSLAAEWRFIQRIFAVLFGHIPLSSTRTEAAAGSATLKNGVVGIEARLAFPGLFDRFRPAIGLGAALSILRIEGAAAQGFTPQSETVFTARIHLRISGAVRITERLAFTFGVLPAHALGGVTVAIAGERTLTWGDFILDGYVGLEIGLL